MENQLTDFESRLTKLESLAATSTSTNSKEDELLTQYQQQILAKLTLIRDKMMSEEGADIDQLKNERNNLLNENNLLKKEIEKLNYRVNHLIKSLNEEEKKHSQA